MTAFLYPLILIHFWYLEAPKRMLSFYKNLNIYLINMFSFRLLLATFFKPIKNEYREGLIAFSIAFGIAVKSMLIFISLFVILIFIIIEFVIFFVFIASPLILIYYLVLT